MDLAISLIVFPCIAPFWLVIAILIKLDSPGPIFYVHDRVGLNGKIFKCLKFRSMRTDADPNKLAESVDDPRITRLGKFLRRSSLDETPQLINVILGQMSIVGPRPALPVQVKHFSEEEMWKLKSKPGLTGWTQVNGRNSIPYDKRMQLDIWYSKKQNIFLDIWILLKTVKVLLVGEGVYDPDSSSPSQ